MAKTFFYVIKLGGKSYDVSFLVGKTLFANQDTNIYSFAMDSAKPIAKIKKGQSLGVLFSFLVPKSGRKVLWLMFEGADRKPYYVPVEYNTIDTEALKKQGVKTTDEIIKQDERDNESTKDKIFRMLKYGAIGLGGVLVLSSFAKGYGTGLGSKKRI